MLFFLVQIPIGMLCGNRCVTIRLGDKDSYKKKISLQSVLLFIDAIVLIVFSAFRNSTIGVDYKNYLYFLKRAGDYTIVSIAQYCEDFYLEIGYGLVTKILMDILNNEIFVMSVLFVVFILCVLFLIRRSSYNSIFSMYLFLTFSFYNQSFNVFRQMLAAAIVLIALPYAKEKKILKFIVIILLASSVHESAIICLLLYPAINIRKNVVKLNVLMVVGAIVLSFQAQQVIEFIVSFTSYDNYLYKEVGSESGIGILINMALFVLYALFYEQFEKEDKYAPLWLFASAMTISLNFYIGTLSMIARIMIYFKLMYIISLPNFLFSIKIIKRNNKYVVYGIIILLFAIYYYFSLKGGAYGTSPYASDILGIG